MVATIVCTVLVATVVVIVVDGATDVHVWRGTGYLEVQYCCAGTKPLRTLATCEYTPALHGAVGHVAVTKTTGMNAATASMFGKMCILDSEALSRQPSAIQRAGRLLRGWTMIVDVSFGMKRPRVQPE
jgi:hypothetical protein